MEILSGFLYPEPANSEIPTTHLKSYGPYYSISLATSHKSSVWISLSPLNDPIHGLQTWIFEKDIDSHKSSQDMKTLSQDRKNCHILLKFSRDTNDVGSHGMACSNSECSADIETNEFLPWTFTQCQTYQRGWQYLAESFGIAEAIKFCVGVMLSLHARDSGMFCISHLWAYTIEQSSNLYQKRTLLIVGYLVSTPDLFRADIEFVSKASAAGTIENCKNEFYFQTTKDIENK